MLNPQQLIGRLMTLFVASAALVALQINPAQAVEADIGKEIIRDADSLRDFVSTHPVDPDHVNTALIFTNAGSQRARVACVAYNQHGTPIDRVWIRVARNGMRFILASEIAGGHDFVGNVKCRSGGYIIGSAILLAPGLTDLPVEQHAHDGMTHIRFPVVAAY